MAESVVATNFFCNNILQVLTTKNYWDVVNEFKPLMHTWSLGIEEQYYFLYPPLFWIVGSRKPNWLLPILIALGLGSVVLVLSPFEDYDKFYLLPFRFYELAAGGITAIVLNNRLIRNPFSMFFVTALALLLLVDSPFMSREVKLLSTVAVTVGVLASPNDKSRVSAFILENRLTIGIGVISFSIYMWHQVLLAYARYFLFQQLRPVQLTGIFILTLGLSVMTYFVIEKPCRNKKKVGTKRLLTSLTVAYLVTSGFALFIYMKGGVIKDVPELDIVASHTSRGMHSAYNMRISDLFDHDFQSNGKVKVLIIGDSFARDWANVLLESKYRADVEISYVSDPESNAEFRRRVAESDVIFYSTPDHAAVRAEGIDESKLYAVGTKNFGISNGIFYNYRGGGYYQQRTPMQAGYLEKNAEMRREWGDKYVDYIDKIISQDNTVPVFTPSGKFISQDCRHLTRAGAQYFAEVFDKEIGQILQNGRRP
jgi:hypothetical protein